MNIKVLVVEWDGRYNDSENDKWVVRDASFPYTGEGFVVGDAKDANTSDDAERLAAWLNRREGITP